MLLFLFAMFFWWRRRQRSKSGTNVAQIPAAGTADHGFTVGTAFSIAPPVGQTATVTSDTLLLDSASSSQHTGRPARSARSSSRDMLSVTSETVAGSSYHEKDFPNETAETTSSSSSLSSRPSTVLMPSSPRPTQSDFDVRSAAPAYSDIQSISWDNATRQERMEEIERMHSRIDHITSSPTDGPAHTTSDEVTMLRLYVAQLERQLYGRYDDPPPEY